MNNSKHIAYITDWKKRNKDKVAKYDKIYRSRNLEKYRIYQATYMKSYRKNNPEKIKGWKKKRNKLKGSYYSYKKRAKRKNRGFSISFEEFKMLVLSKCHYCGVPCTEEKRNSIDRKDNNFGYVKENCLPCCVQCNNLKGSSSYLGFISRVKKFLPIIKNLF